jgi:hypothetical protein
MIDTRLLRQIRLTRQDHPFFDSFVVVLAAAASLRQAYVAQLEGKAVPYRLDDSGSIQGMPHVTNVRLYFRPADVLNPLAQDSWPAQVILFERSLGAHPSPPDEKAAEYHSAEGFRGVTDVMMRSAFVVYYEAQDPVAHFGDNGPSWPQVWRFGRIVRNALTHNGCIDIRNPNAPPESWRSLTYSPADNGKPILFRDFAIPDLLYLMMDMEAAT